MPPEQKRDITSIRMTQPQFQPFVQTHSEKQEQELFCGTLWEWMPPSSQCWKRITPSTTHSIISIKAIVFTVQQKEWEETDGHFFSKKFKKQKRAIGFNGIKKMNPQSLHKTFGNSPQPKTSSCGVFLVLATRGRKVTIAVQTDIGIYIQNRSTLE